MPPPSIFTCATGVATANPHAVTHLIEFAQTQAGNSGISWRTVAAIVIGLSIASISGIALCLYVNRRDEERGPLRGPVVHYPVIAQPVVRVPSRRDSWPYITPRHSDELPSYPPAMGGGDGGAPLRVPPPAYHPGDNPIQSRARNL